MSYEDQDSGYDEGGSGGDTSTIERGTGSRETGTRERESSTRRQDRGIHSVVEQAFARQKRDRGVPDEAVRKRAETEADKARERERSPNGRSMSDSVDDAYDQLKERNAREQMDSMEATMATRHYRGLEQYVATAQQNGIRFQDSVHDYVDLEQAVRQNPVRGFLYAMHRMNLDPHQMAHALHQAANGPEGSQLTAEIGQQARFFAMNRLADNFCNDKRFPHAGELIPDMNRLLQTHPQIWQIKQVDPQRALWAAYVVALQERQSSVKRGPGRGAAKGVY